MNLNFEEKKIAAENWFKNLRNSICAEFEKIEYLKSKKKKIFKKNNWKAGGNSKGGGTFALIENGSVFEKVGVNISTISGKFHKQFRRKIPGALNNPNFWASGISVVAHMKNPKVPAFHFNTRFIVTSKSWFGGGMDMTPSIEDLKQKKYFHQEIKKMCNLHDKNYYSQHKKNCDQYFYLPHRNEPRGDGGIFYDYLNSKNWNKDFNYTKDVGITFLKISSRIIQKKMFLKWNGWKRLKLNYKKEFL
ncbi:MAG: coproporphyrinogen III oxidase [Proteobacteria bacterium]|nr:coproporphyrinogen III oxidase [Pseudomonadota bacterium]